MRALLAALLLLPVALRAEPVPRVCETALSTITIDLGHYRGAYDVRTLAGAALPGDAWHLCPPQRSARENSLQTCNFSLCDLPDGEYALHLGDAPLPPLLIFRAQGGRLALAPSTLAVQAGNYGVDASGGMVPVRFDLRGYPGPWRPAHWPGFLGDAPSGRALRDEAGHTVLLLYPGGPYAFDFGGAAAAVTVGLDGAPAATGALAVKDGVLLLRGARVAVTPSAPDAAWTLGGARRNGAATVFVPAGARLDVQEAGAEAQHLVVDAACGVSLAAGRVRVLASGGCQ